MYTKNTGNKREREKIQEKFIIYVIKTSFGYNRRQALNVHLVSILTLTLKLHIHKMEMKFRESSRE